ncbi:hypothetical protein FRC15_008241 [Serendipita sp. 397]|nr:hypothetical protein FRC15_008241 [Serendipita sp. 397]
MSGGEFPVAFSQEKFSVVVSFSPQQTEPYRMPKKITIFTILHSEISSPMVSVMLIDELESGKE